MTNLTIAQAMKLASSPEQLQAQSIELIQAVVDTIQASSNPKAIKKLEIVKGVLANKKKESKDAKEIAEIEQVENSVKTIKRKPKPIVKVTPKAQAVAEKKAEQISAELISQDEALELMGKTVAPNQYENFEEDKPLTEWTIKELQAELDKKKIAYAKKATKPTLIKLLENPPKAEEKPEPKQEPVVETAPEQEEMFPVKMLNDAGEHIRTRIELKDLQDAIKKHVYKVVCFIQEPNREKYTGFLVTYANSEVVVLLDMTEEINSVVPFSTKSFNAKKKTVKMDGVECECAFYIPAK